MTYTEAVALVAAMERLIREAEASLDYRPEFRHAIADAYTACVVLRESTLIDDLEVA